MSYLIYIYVDGSDNDTFKDQFIAEITALVCKSNGLFFVDDLFPREAGMREEDLPDWNLGVNFELSELKEGEIKEVIAFFVCLATKSRRDFVVGYLDRKLAFTEDIGFIEAFKPEDKIIDVLLSLKGSSH